MNLQYMKAEQIKPSGWMKAQFDVLANGAFPALYSDCEEINRSKWLGKDCDESCELFPVWLDGYIRIAYMSESEKLRENAVLFVKKVLTLQKENGWLSPLEQSESVDLYPTFLMLNALITFYLYTHSQKVFDAIISAVKAADVHTDEFAICKNAHARFAVIKDCLDFLCKSSDEEFLPVMLKKLECQAFSWDKYEISLNAPSRWSQVLDNVLSLRTLSVDALRELDKKFSLADGSVAGCPTLERPSAAGQSDTEAMCEYIKTILSLFQKSADPSLIDMAENLLFNAYFGAMNSDMSAVQPSTKLNEIKAVYTCGRKMVPCGSVLPSFISSAVMKTDDGFAINSFIPFVVNTEINGKAVKIETVTEYPFRGTVKIIVTCAVPSSFTLSVRIPYWADEVKVSTGQSPMFPLKNAYCNFSGVWSETTEFTVSIASDFRLTRCENDLFTLSKGILLFAMPIEEKKHVALGDERKKFQSYELSADSKWAFGLFVNNKDAVYKEISYEEKPVAQQAFSTLTPPVEAYIYGKPVEWQMKDGEPVKKPLAVKISEKKEMLRFVPYGCTGLKMTAFPKA